MVPPQFVLPESRQFVLSSEQVESYLLLSLRLEVEILNERDLVASLAVHEFINESLGQQNTESTWAHSAGVTVFDMA
jgi:hypothetical protein